MINDLVLLSCVGIRPVLVHGGGPEINTWLEKLGIEAQFKNGLRVTDGEQLWPVNFSSYITQTRRPNCMKYGALCGCFAQDRQWRLWTWFLVVVSTSRL